MEDFEPIPPTRVYGATQQTNLGPPMPPETQLPLERLDPPVFERVVVEFLRIYIGAKRIHVYGRSGQKQYGLDVVGVDQDGDRFVCQVRRTLNPTPDDIEDAIMEYVGPDETHVDPNEPTGRKFNARKYFLALASTIDDDTAKVNRAMQLQQDHGDIEIEVCGREVISSQFHESPGLVSAIFGRAWAEAFCGSSVEVDQEESATWYGILEGPLEALGLTEASKRAAELLESEPDAAAELFEYIASSLRDHGYQGHADIFMSRSADGRRRDGRFDEAHSILLAQAIEQCEAGETHRDATRELKRLDPNLSSSKQAATHLIDSYFQWFGQGFPLLEVTGWLMALGDDVEIFDRLRLTCLAIEFANVDEIFEPRAPIVGGRDEAFPRSEVEKLISISSSFTSGRLDASWRARLGCAVADARCRLERGAGQESDARRLYRSLIREADSGRWNDDVSSLVLARAARAHLHEGRKFDAIELWRNAIRRAFAAGLGGDVRYFLRALRFTIDSVQPYELSSTENDRAAEIALLVPPDIPRLMTALPNRRVLLFPKSTAQLLALELVQSGKYREGFSTARRNLSEVRTRGHVIEEILANDLFADDLSKVERLSGAVQFKMRANRAKEAAKLAKDVSEWVDVEHDLTTMPPWVAGAGASVVAAQWDLVPEDRLAGVLEALLDLASRIWRTNVIVQSPDKKAYTALCRFGNRIPADLTSRVLDVVEGGSDSDNALAKPSVGLLARMIYEGLDEERATAILIKFSRTTQGQHAFWNVASSLHPSLALIARVEELVTAGDRQAATLLARWRRMNAEARYVARLAIDELLSLEVGVPRDSFSVGNLPLMVGHLTSALVLEGDLESGQPGAVCEPSEHVWALSAAVGELAEAVISRYVELARDSTDIAQNRDQALVGLTALIRHLPASLWIDHLSTLRRLAANPEFGLHDEIELSSLDPLSGARFDTGARTLQALALNVASEAVKGAWTAGFRSDELRQTTQGLREEAEVLLQSGDSEVEQYAGSSIALLSVATESGYELLAFHRNSDVRKFASETWVNSPSAQSRSWASLAEDDYPDVRGSCIRISRAIETSDPTNSTALHEKLLRDRSAIVRRRAASASVEDS